MKNSLEALELDYLLIQNELKRLEEGQDLEKKEEKMREYYKKLGYKI